MRSMFSTDRDKPRFAYSLATLFWLITVFIVGFGMMVVAWKSELAHSEIRRLEQRHYADLTFPVGYDRLTLLRTGEQMIVIRFVSNPGDDPGHISYEWIEFPVNKIGEVADGTDWKDVFDQTPECKRGIGSANEEGGGGDIIVVDGLALRWSHGGPEFGWLYLSETNFSGSGMRPVSFDTYREQLKTISELNSLHDWWWKSIALQSK